MWRWTLWTNSRRTFLALLDLFTSMFWYVIFVLWIWSWLIYCLQIHSFRIFFSNIFFSQHTILREFLCIFCRFIFMNFFFLNFSWAFPFLKIPFFLEFFLEFFWNFFVHPFFRREKTNLRSSRTAKIHNPWQYWSAAPIDTASSKSRTPCTTDCAPSWTSSRTVRAQRHLFHHWGDVNVCESFCVVFSRLVLVCVQVLLFLAPALSSLPCTRSCCASSARATSKASRASGWRPLARPFWLFPRRWPETRATTRRTWWWSCRRNIASPRRRWEWIAIPVKNVRQFYTASWLIDLLMDWLIGWFSFDL